MKVTFIIKHFTDYAFEKLEGMTNAERYECLRKAAKGDLKHIVSMKIGNGQFNQAVDFNIIMKAPKGVDFEYKLEPRRGYKLATFEITPAKTEVLSA